MLSHYKQWCCIDTRKIPQKAPRTPSGNLASVKHPNTYSTLKACNASILAGRNTHLGFILTQDDPYVFIDIDTFKKDPKKPPVSDAVRAKVMEIIQDFTATYQEISLSGEGIHIICKADEIPELLMDNSRNGPLRIEVYYTGRMMVMTGNTVGTKRITYQSNALVKWLPVLFPVVKHRKSIVEKPKSVSDVRILEQLHRNGKYRALYGGDNVSLLSSSEGDLSLMGYLYYLCKNKEQAILLFMTSVRGERVKLRRSDYVESLILKVST